MNTKFGSEDKNLSNKTFRNDTVTLLTALYHQISLVIFQNFISLKRSISYTNNKTNRHVYCLQRGEDQIRIRITSTRKIKITNLKPNNLKAKDQTMYPISISFSWQKVPGQMPSVINFIVSLHICEYDRTVANMKLLKFRRK